MLIFQWNILRLNIIHFDSLESLLSLWGASYEHQRFLCSLVTLSYKPRCDDFDHFHQAHNIISWEKKQDALGVQRERKLPVEKEKRHSHHLPLQEKDDCSERWRQKQSSSPIYEWAWKPPSLTKKKKLVLVSVPFVHWQVPDKGVMSKARVRAELIRPRKKRSHKFVSSIAEGRIWCPLGPRIQCG